jgi:hypothetical protein
MAFRVARYLFLVEGLFRWLIVASAASYLVESDYNLPGSILALVQALIVGIPALSIGLTGRLPRRSWPISLFLRLNLISGIADVLLSYTATASPWWDLIVGLATLVASILMLFVAFPHDRLERPLMIAARLVLLGNGIARYAALSYIWPFIAIYGGLTGISLFFVPALVGALAIFIALAPRLSLGYWQIWSLIVLNALSGVLDLAVAAANYLPFSITASIGILTLGSTAALVVAAFRPRTPMAWFAAARSD